MNQHAKLIDCGYCGCPTSKAGHDPKAEKGADGMYVFSCRNCGRSM